MPELTHWSERLRQLNACGQSLWWAAKQESPLAAWRACERGDWLLWIAATLNVDRRLVVQAACTCARLALPHVPEGEDRPLKAIEAAERWADGLATIEEVRQAADAAARAAAHAATAAATAAAYAAADAAYAAADAAYAAARASRSAYAAARASRYATAAAYAALADANNACAAVLRQCADIVRSVISEDVMLAAWPDEEDTP